MQDAINIRPGPQGAKDSKARLEVLNMSLRGLLDYTEDDTAEATFEASMFGELFLEMLQARFGRDLLRTLPLVAEQVRVKHAGWVSGLLAAFCRILHNICVWVLASCPLLDDMIVIWREWRGLRCTNSGWQYNVSLIYRQISFALCHVCLGSVALA